MLCHIIILSYIIWELSYKITIYIILSLVVPNGMAWSGTVSGPEVSSSYPHDVAVVLGGLSQFVSGLL